MHNLITKTTTISSMKIYVLFFVAYNILKYPKKIKTLLCFISQTPIQELKTFLQLE